MTQKDKELLFKDLCSRLPYKVKVQIPDKHGGYTTVIESIDIDGCITDSEGECLEVEKVKPYLFPTSSMTEEQMQDMIKSSIGIGSDKNVFDWYLKNHFDFRELLSKGLALDATGKDIY